MVLDPHPWPIEVAWRNMCREHDDFLHALQPDLLCTGAGILNNVWRPRMDDFVKLNTDGGYRETENCMGGGGLLRDKAGCWLAGFSSFAHGGDALTAETLALCEGLVMAWEHGYTKVSCDIDCEELVTILDRAHEHSVDHHPQVNLLKDIMAIMARDWRVSVNWVHRDGNAAADWLAKHGHSLLTPCVHAISQPESELQLLLLKDSLAVP